MKKVKLHQKSNKIKLVCFDFDNTLKLTEDHIKKYTKYTSLHSYELELNRYLEKIRKNNVKIFINTGRSYGSFLKDNEFKYDYLACNNGCEMYDKDNNLLQLNPLDQRDIMLINSLKPNFNYTIKKYYPKDTNQSDKMTAVSIQFVKDEGFGELIDYFNNNLVATSCFYKYPKIRLVNAKVNKQHSIDYVKNLLHLANNELCVIGDDNNDYIALKNNRAYVMSWQSEQLKTLNLLSFDDIVQFIKYLGRHYDK